MFGQRRALPQRIEQHLGFLAIAQAVAEHLMGEVTGQGLLTQYAAGKDQIEQSKRATEQKHIQPDPDNQPIAEQAHVLTMEMADEVPGAACGAGKRCDDDTN